MHKQFDKPDKIIKNLFTSGFVLRDKEGRSTGRQVRFPGAQEKFAEYKNFETKENCKTMNRRIPPTTDLPSRARTW